jgi:hypothetical protein
VTLDKSGLKITLPAKSVVVLEITVRHDINED